MHWISARLKRRPALWRPGMVEHPGQRRIFELNARLADRVQLKAWARLTWCVHRSRPSRGVQQLGLWR